MHWIRHIIHHGDPSYRGVRLDAPSAFTLVFCSVDVHVGCLLMFDVLCISSVAVWIPFDVFLHAFRFIVVHSDSSLVIHRFSLD